MRATGGGERVGSSSGLKSIDDFKFHFTVPVRRVIYLHRKHTPPISRIAVTSFELHESRSNLLQYIYSQYMQLYKSLEILLKDNNKLENLIFP